MTLRLVEPPSTPRPASYNAELSEAARALAQVKPRLPRQSSQLAVDAHLRLLGKLGAGRADVLGVRLVQGTEAERGIAELLEQAMEAVTRLLDSPFSQAVRPSTVAVIESARDICKREHEDLIRDDWKARAERRQREVHERVELYRTRFAQSDLPGEDELRLAVKRNLVHAGYWTVEQVAAAGPTAIAEVKMVGPKGIQQITDLLAKRGLTFGGTD